MYYTVWKSTLKLYHAEKFSVKMHGKILLIPILQMDEFLYLGDILVQGEEKRFCRVEINDEITQKNFFETPTMSGDISCQK